MKRKPYRVVFLSLVFAAGVTLAEYVICPRCGYENEDVRSACSHCRGKLPESAKPVASAPKTGAESPTPVVSDTEPATGEGAPSPGADDSLIPEATLAEEVALGKKYISQGELDVGRLFLKNASALDMLRAPDAGRNLSKEISDLLSRCDAVGARIQRRCPECDGTGKQSLGIRRLRGEVEYRPSVAKCERCGGKGFFADVGLASERKFRIGRAINKYTQLQQARRYVPIGGAWVPADLESRLTIRQIVTLKRATAPPCEECMGVGRTNCEECKGAGLVECPNRDCKDGWVTDEKSGQLSKLSTIRHRTRCTVCGGKGKAACEECLGRGSLVCEECGGTGQSELCSRCGGQGMAPCRRCRGTGAYRGVQCETCGGSGSALCSSCGGDGRK